MHKLGFRFPLFLWLLIAALSLVLGCSTDLKPPIAEFTLDPATVMVGAAVTLDGSTSSDPNGQALAYHFRLTVLPPGSKAVVAEPDAMTTSVTPDVAGDYTVELVVSDGALTSVPMTATFTAGPCSVPTLSAISSSPADPSAGDAVLLSSVAADANTDPACGAAGRLTVAWSLVAMPTGSHATLNDASLEKPSLFTDVPGAYQVQVVATNGAGQASAPSSATITVSGCAASTPEVVSVTASTRSPDTGERVTLSAVVRAVTESGTKTGPAPPVPADAGSAPSAVDGGAPSGGTGTPGVDAGTGCTQAPRFTLHWTLVSVPPGSAASLVDSPLEDPSFVTDVPGKYVAELFATNAGGRASGTKRVTVTAGVCGSRAPVATAPVAAPAAPAIGQAVQLSTTVTDADTAAPCSAKEVFAYVWSLTAAPPGSAAHLNDGALVAPSFTVDVAGTYAVTLVVVDAEGHASAPVTSTVVASACGSNAPVVSTVTATPASAGSGATVALAATVTDADTTALCKITESFTLTWTLASVPAGSRATLNDEHQAAPWFVADVPGAYVIAVAATDGEGLTSAPKSVTVTATTCGTAAPTVTSIGVGPSAPLTGGGVALSAQVTDADTGGTCKRTESFTYAWALTAAPGGSLAALKSTTTPLSGFVPDAAGTYTVSLVVKDSEGHSSAVATQTITVGSPPSPSSCGLNAPIARLAGFTAGTCAGLCAPATIAPAVSSPPNPTPPGYTLALNGHGTVRLDASASFDADNAAPCGGRQNLFYTWTILAAPVGSAARWSIGSGVTTTMVAPTFDPDLPGVYQVGVIVSDGQFTSAQLVVQITM